MIYTYDMTYRNIDVKDKIAMKNLNEEVSIVSPSNMAAVMSLEKPLCKHRINKTRST